MIELNFEQLDLVSGGCENSALTSCGGGDWLPYSGQQPLRSGGGRSVLMQDDGSNGDVPRPTFIP
ncbi:hypothetical protein [Janthinobacterium sp. 78]|uniref:hypothetical protein n=1 Tax=Janthinobacterium sp. 78 TaxID=2135631 RepID=UPI001057BB66|nr:hypothetical protein [Janthinobacterium sp. 78]